MKAADLYERKNGSTYREFEIGLPRELSEKQRIELVQEWVKQEIGDKHPYQFAIHNPKAMDGGEQPHAHIMFNERKLDGIERDPDQYFKRFNSKTLNVVVVRNSIQARITQLESRKLKRFGKGGNYVQPKS